MPRTASTSPYALRSPDAWITGAGMEAGFYGGNPGVRGCSAELDVAMDHARHDVVARGDVAGDPVGDRDRAVAAARAADGDRQVGLALGDIGGEQEVEEREQPAVVLAGQLARFDVLDDRRVAAGQRPQVLAIVRIRKEADVQ